MGNQLSSEGDNMVKILMDLNKEQDEKIKYFKMVFDLKTKKDAILKIIDLTKIKSFDREKEKDDILEMFE